MNTTWRAAAAAAGIVVALIAGCDDGTDINASDGPAVTTTELVTTTTTEAPTTTTTEAPTTTTTTEAPTTTTTERVTTTTTVRRTTTTAARAAGCHPSYTRTCIPPDVSDADCAGGSGNGPYYVREKNIGVVGPDEYDLDRDGDGVGCES